MVSTGNVIGGLQAADPRAIEWLKCRLSCEYFTRYVKIYDSQVQAWVTFNLWPAQAEVLRAFREHKKVVVLKARQLGLTWLTLTWALYLALFYPAQEVLLFSRREPEAIHLLDDRLKGMYSRLPAFLKAAGVVTDAKTVWALTNGSVIRAFPTTAGDSYAATLAIVDEADIIPDLGAVLAAVKPTIDTGGRIILVSRANKDEPNSEFKALYRAAQARQVDWHPVFLPWNARPDRDAVWYKGVEADILAGTGSLDRLWEQYPTTDAEALAARQTNKRFPAEWVLRVAQPTVPVDQETVVATGGPDWLRVYRLPDTAGDCYIGVDPAEGLSGSDDSALVVVNDNLEEVACFYGKVEPGVFAPYVAQVAEWYNNAPVLVERNNHGHAVLLWLQENTTAELVLGDDAKPGWLTTTKSKVAMWARVADKLGNGNLVLHTQALVDQLASLDENLRSEKDDLAMALALAVTAEALGSCRWGLLV